MNLYKFGVGSLVAVLITASGAVAQGSFGDTGASQWGVGFELFWDGRKVNGPETEFFSFQQAQESCNANFRPGIIVECRYHGRTFQRWTP